MLLYGIKSFWHPMHKHKYDVFTTPDILLVLEQICACERYRVDYETFVSYVHRFEV